MSKDELELLGEYRNMTLQNKKHFLFLAHAIRSTQETTKAEMSHSAGKQASGKPAA